MTSVNINDVKSSLSFLMSAMVDTGRAVMTETFGMQKPSWLSQTERFESFFSQLSVDESGVDSFRDRFVVPLFTANKESVTSRIINDSDVIQDQFIKVKEDDTHLRLSRSPRGLYLHSDEGAALKSLYLPISEAYTNAVEMSMKHKQRNVMFPVKILLGFYSMMFYSLKDVPEHTSHEDVESFRENVKVLKEYMDSLDEKEEPADQDDGPMGMIKNLLGNVNFDQIGDMMNKVTNDEAASAEFKQVFDKMTSGIQNGQAPMDVMGSIIKEATTKATEDAALQELPPLDETTSQPQTTSAE